MGASNYTYAEATWTQTLPDWIGAHVRALAFMGGVPAQLVPDNPKVGVDGSPSCSIAKPPSATIGGCGHGCATPGCVTRLRSKTSITVPPAGSTVRCSRR